MIVAAPIVAVVSIVGSASDAIDDVTDAFDSLPDDVVVPDPPEPPAGIGGGSLIASDNFAATLERMRGEGRAVSIRLAPDRAAFQLVKGGRLRIVSTDGAGLDRSPPSPGAAGVPAVALAAIDAGAPARLVRRAAARYAVSERGINYLVMSPAPGTGHRWVAYFKNGVYVEGDRRGRVVRRIS